MKLNFLENCEPETRQQFEQLGKVLTVPRGQLCIRAREEIPGIYFILEGKVQIYNLTSCGKKKILFVLGKGQIANESLTKSLSSVFCETLEACSFFVIRQKDLLTLMEKDFQLTQALFQYQERKIWRLEHQLKNTVGSIFLERKLAAKLWKLCRDFGVPTEEGLMIDIDLSITFLSDFLGAPRETTSRICKRLADRGLIIMNKKRICIPNPDQVVFFYKTGTLKPKEKI